jgi:hypothetical protein
LSLTTPRQRQSPRRKRAILRPAYRFVSIAGVVIDNRPVLRVRRRDKCYATLAMSIATAVSTATAVLSARQRQDREHQFGKSPGRDSAPCRQSLRRVTAPGCYGRTGECGALPTMCGSPRIGLNALASTDQPFRSGPSPAGRIGLLVAVLPGSPGDAFGGGFGRLADGSGIAGSRRADWAGGFR